MDFSRNPVKASHFQNDTDGSLLFGEYNSKCLKTCQVEEKLHLECVALKEILDAGRIYQEAESSSWEGFLGKW
jgi:hypothetical protein